MSFQIDIGNKKLKFSSHLNDVHQDVNNTNKNKENMLIEKDSANSTADQEVVTENAAIINF